MHARLRIAVLGGLTLGLAAPHAAAQVPAADHWGSWTGCWRLVSETGAVNNTDRPTVCVATAAGGARLTTMVEGRVALEQTIVADGTSRPIDDGDCRGSERYEWSGDGLRVYSQTEVTCTSSPGLRRISGYALLLQDGSWLDIQAVEVSLRDSVRIRRYRRVDSDVAARPAPGHVLDLADVKEASRKLAPAAVEAAIAESGSPIPLSSKRLLDLEDAGVPGRIIDLLVATAYPGKFVVDRGPSARVAHAGVYHAYPYFYSPFGYSPYGWWDPYYYYPGGGGGIIIINPPIEPGPPPVASGGGRAVDGRGYTQVRPRSEVTPHPATAGTSSAGGTSASTASAPISSGSSSSGSSGSSVSSSGFSSGGGGGGGDSGRTAVPR